MTITTIEQADAARKQFQQDASRLRGTRKTIAKAKRVELQNLVSAHRQTMCTAANTALDGIIAAAERIAERARKAKADFGKKPPSFGMKFSALHTLAITDNLYTIVDHRNVFSTVLDAVIDADKPTGAEKK